MKERFICKFVANFCIVLVVLVIALASGLSYTAVSVSAKSGAIYKGSNDNRVSLMVNVYWGNEFIEQMLDIFATNGVKTTFFVGGSWVRDNEQLLKKIVENGHELGNHGFYHKNHDKISEERNRQEISATHELVKSVCGVEMNLFAPPSGAFNNKTLDIAEKLGYTTIMWSKDTIDWRDQDESVIFRRATKNIRGGDLVLMHPTKATCAVLDKIIKEISNHGLTVSTVSEVIKPI